MERVTIQPGDLRSQQIACESVEDAAPGVTVPSKTERSLERAFFSIIVVSYDPGDRLARTLESVLAQTEASWRVLVKDAGSVDGSVEAARERFSDHRIRWEVRPDGGIYDGMNQALESAVDLGRIIYFLNCGDLLHDPEVLARVRAAIEGDGGAGTGIWYGSIVEARTGQRVAANPRLDAFACYRHLPNHQACFYDAELMRGERFDARYRVRADYEHFLRCFLGKGVGARAMDLVICDYEGGGFSETPRGRKLSAREHREIAGKYFTRGQRARYKLYLWLTLQPLRRRLADSPRTAGAYHRLRSALLEMRR